MKGVTSCIMWFFLIAAQAQAQSGQYDFDARCKLAYQEILAMNLDSGTALASQEQKANPGNLIPILLDNYADFFRLFFTEDPALYKTLQGGFPDRINRLGEGDHRSPFYRYALAVSHFQRALICIKFQEDWTAAWQFRKAYLLLKDNAKQFPGFAPDGLLLGTMETVIGTIPGAYKWGVSILGMEGNISEGMQQLEKFIADTSAEGKIFQGEGYIYYCYLEYFIENKQQQSLQFILDRQLDLKHNELFALMAMNLTSDLQMGSYGLGIADAFRPAPGYFRIPLMDFELGNLELDRLELDSAVLFIGNYVNEFKGNFYLKDALLRMSWAQYLQGNLVEAEKYRTLVLNRGTTETDADKAAVFDASESGWPNTLLLKARLLSDGGYFDRALALLKNAQVTDFPNPADKIEYVYRLARIYDLNGNPNEAIPFYEITIKTGSNRPEYFAARAALELGGLYEKKGDSSKAVTLYQQCLSMDEKQYKNSLDQRAKAGINRLTGK